MSYRVWIACALGVLGLGCAGDGGDGGSVSELFEVLSGTYVIDEEAGCRLQVHGSHLNTLSDGGGTTCTDSFGEGTRTLAVDGTFSDTHVSGSLEYRVMGAFGNERTHAEVIADKVMDRTAEGRFAALAGKWEGMLTYTEEDESPEGDIDRNSGTNRVVVDVFGDYATVSYEHDGEVDMLEVRDFAGDITVDGEIVDYEEL